MEVQGKIELRTRVRVHQSLEIMYKVTIFLAAWIAQTIDFWGGQLIFMFTREL